MLKKYKKFPHNNRIYSSDEKYKVFSGENYIDAMISLKEEGMSPLSLKEVLEKRISADYFQDEIYPKRLTKDKKGDVYEEDNKELETIAFKNASPINNPSFWSLNKIGTSDGVAYHPDGKIKLVKNAFNSLDRLVGRGIVKGGIMINEKEWENIGGPRKFREEDFGARSTSKFFDYISSGDCDDEDEAIKRSLNKNPYFDLVGCTSSSYIDFFLKRGDTEFYPEDNLDLICGRLGLWSWDIEELPCPIIRPISIDSIYSSNRSDIIDYSLERGRKNENTPLLVGKKE